ncbi:MAG: phage integrase SAM-like domain-containing protein, partial [Bacteroidota bacterium]
MNKKILPAYQPPRLVSGTSRTYILVYAQNRSGSIERYRPTFNLNRIHNLTDREERGTDLLKKIKWWLEQGYLFEDFDERKVIIEIKQQEAEEPTQERLIDVIARIRDEKIGSTDRRASKRSYRSHANIFISYLEKKGLSEILIGEFSKAMAKDYTRYWYSDLGCASNITYNTKLTYIKGFFITMIEDELIEKNPFASIKSKIKTKAAKENFSIAQMQILSAELRKRKPFLWAATQLAFWGLVRQEEMSRLKFRMFNVKKWTIVLGYNETKNRKDDIITLPTFLREQFREIGFFDHPHHHYIIANNLEPGT